jgi:hypothetical protein
MAPKCNRPLETAGSAAALAARCRKFRLGSFILNLPLASHHSITSSRSLYSSSDGVRGLGAAVKNLSHRDSRNVASA